MIRKFIEKQKAKRTFKKLVDPETVEKLFRDGPESPQYHPGRVEFIVTFVRGKNPDEVSKRIAVVTDIATALGAMNHGIIGPLVIVAFGTHPASAPTPGNRLLLVQSLRQELDRDIKIVHGAAQGHYGIFGKEPVSYTFLVPKFDEVLGKLSQLEFGWVAEFP